MKKTEEGVRSDMYIVNSFLRTVALDWATASTIYDMTGVTPKDVRVVCQAYPHLLVSSTAGYKLTRYASKREVQHCVTTLLSRSEKMIQRAAALSTKLVR